MVNKKLEGIIVPIVTPFTQDGKLDEALFQAEARYLLNAGVNGISPGGSTGEGASLSDQELARMVALIREVDQNIPIVAGVIRNSTQAAVETALAAKQAGADALMITPVSYNVLVPDDEGNYTFYETIARKVDLPIVIYNVVPQNTITPELLRRIAQIPNVVGIKQSCGGIGAFYAMVMHCGDICKVFSATDDMLYSTYELGASGAISAILSVFPELCVEMWKSVKAGDLQHGLELQHRMYHPWQAIAGNQFPIRIKHALRLLGRDPGYARSPIVHISQEEQNRIQTALQASGFIQSSKL